MSSQIALYLHEIDALLAGEEESTDHGHDIHSEQPQSMMNLWLSQIDDLLSQDASEQHSVSGSISSNNNKQMHFIFIRIIAETTCLFPPQKTNTIKLDMTYSYHPQHLHHHQALPLLQHLLITNQIVIDILMLRRMAAI